MMTNVKSAVVRVSAIMRVCVRAHVWCHSVCVREERERETRKREMEREIHAI